MANNCFYELKVIGERSSCVEWHRRMIDRDSPNSFRRIFSAEICGEQERDDGLYEMDIIGDCAWSLETCCRESGYAGRDLFAANSADLHILMEAWSKEPGIGFSEHYIYDSGVCLTAEEADYEEWYWDKSEYPDFDRFAAEYPDAPSVDLFDEDGNASIFGFGAPWVWNI